MVYVELNYEPTVQLMRCSVRQVIVERATEPPMEVPEGSSKERGFRVGWHCLSCWRLIQGSGLYIGNGVCQARRRGAGCACVSIERLIGETMSPRSCQRARARDGPRRNR